MDAARRSRFCYEIVEGKVTAMDHTNFDPDYVFSHHPATPEKLAHYDAIHVGAKQLAQVILQHVPECSDRLAVLRLLREASMLACAAVSLEGRFK
jgi:hypothetical protein